MKGNERTSRTYMSSPQTCTLSHTHAHTHTHIPHKAKGPEKGGGGSCPVCFISSGRIIQPVSLMPHSLLPSHTPTLSPESLNFFFISSCRYYAYYARDGYCISIYSVKFLLISFNPLEHGHRPIVFFVRFLFSVSTAVFIFIFIYLFLPSFF